ncbi:MAG TPA: hypothetical protein VM537_08295 [Anaerolineae bacterium]|nr:hypothetical protein [Anaerolineae bacterium]
MPANELGTAQIPVRATMDQLDKDLSQVHNKVESSLARTAAKVAKIGLGLAIGGITAGAAAAAGALKLAVDALPLQGISNAFAGITGNAEGMISKLREGSLGLVKDADLMKSYNQAAQLVSKTFADQLPDAMGYLSKVAAATGQDMGFMLDSLVKGVGRVSPMILDNLGIQVNLTEATEAYAKVLGKDVKELTKAEAQTAVMNMTMQKLAENTAAMPDVAGSATAEWANLGVQLANVKDRIGLALIPSLGKLMKPISGLAKTWLPKLTEGFEKKVVPAVEKAADWIADLSNVVSDFLEGVNIADVPWEDFFPPWLADRAYKISAAIEWVRDTIPKLTATFPGFKNTWNNMLKGVRVDWTPLAQALEALGVSPELAAKAAGVTASVTGWLQDAWDKAKIAWGEGKLAGLWELLKTEASKVDLSAIVTSIKTKISELWTGETTWIEGFPIEMPGLQDKILGWFSTIDWERVGSTLAEGFKTAAGWLGGALLTILNKAADISGALREWLTSEAAQKVVEGAGEWMGTQIRTGIGSVLGQAETGEGIVSALQTALDTIGSDIQMIGLSLGIALLKGIVKGITPKWLTDKLTPEFKQAVEESFGGAVTVAVAPALALTAAGREKLKDEMDRVIGPYADMTFGAQVEVDTTDAYSKLNALGGFDLLLQSPKLPDLDTDKAQGVLNKFKGQEILLHSPALPPPDTSAAMRAINVYVAVAQARLNTLAARLAAGQPAPIGGPQEKATGFQGWVTQPQLWLVGEHGPEYVSLTPESKMPQGRGGDSYEIIVQVTGGANPEETGRRVGNAVITKMREKGWR